VRQGLGRILDRSAIHIGEVVSVDGAHGCTFQRSRVILTPIGRQSRMCVLGTAYAVLPGRGDASGGAGGVPRMMLVAMLTTAARSERFPGTTRVVLSLASLPN